MTDFINADGYWIRKSQIQSVERYDKSTLRIRMISGTLHIALWKGTVEEYVNDVLSD